MVNIFVLEKDSSIEDNVKTYIGWRAFGICVVCNLNKYCYILHMANNVYFLDLVHSGIEMNTIIHLYESYYSNNK